VNTPSISFTLSSEPLRKPCDHIPKSPTCSSPSSPYHRSSQLPVSPPSSYPSILPIICPPNPAGPHPPAPTSFCKCVCFTNSTIIALDPPASSPTSPASRNALFAARADGANSDSGLDEDGRDRKEYRAGNCNDCNRQFCLDYNLPICKGAKMEDVFTTCFRTFPSSFERVWVSRDGSNESL